MEISKRRALRLIQRARDIETNARAAAEWVGMHGQTDSGWVQAFNASLAARRDAESLVSLLLETFVSDATVAEPVAPSEAG